MTVSNSWRQAYKDLTDFVAGNPEIKIGMNIIAIPRDTRPEFYRLFETVILAIVEENFPKLLNKAEHLSGSYTKAEEEVIKLLGLDEVSMEVDLYRFVHDPRNQLMRGLLDPLFDLLKGKIDVETFDKEASGNIDVTFRNLYRTAYQKWVVLSLVKLLVADRSFDVSVPPLEMDETTGQVIRIRPELVPELKPKESKRLSFKRELVCTFMVPDFIVHSTLINQYVAFRSDNATAMWTASEVSEKREWYPFDPIMTKYTSITPGLALSIYVDDTPEDLALIADSERVCRPDLVLECMEQKDWYQKEGLEMVKIHHDILKPTLGTFIASEELVPEHTSEKLVEESRLLIVGFDQSKLDSIIDVLKPQAESQMA